MILSIDTSGREGSVALRKEGKLVEQIELPGQPRSTQTLAPAIQKLLKQHDLPPQEIEAIAVTTGPGSFTGLRVGVMTAKTMAYALKVPIVGVDTLQAIAQAAAPVGEPVCVLLNAQRREWFVGEYLRTEENTVPAPVQPIRILSQTAFWKWWEEQSSSLWLTGPGLSQVAEDHPSRSRWLDRASRQPQASFVGELAEHRLAVSEIDDVWQLVPQYYRPSAAEEKWAEKQKR
ncbi:tRNA (Adenosine(37)-N6)-threonylcarbamoyltransferase complex dimerization subunit type 1 TsaB [Planctomycetales bacterium 10988]|nr:tRNA (Adenosine(37)-N6)-threonylcarbamoyltransferase complex dimerization subunit type 1 TsaB [Planctomycetales bacterium 10988]